MKYFLVLLMVCGLGWSIEQSMVPNQARQNSGIQTNLFAARVNPVTGEYVDDACDLVVPGCEVLSARRFYNHMAYPNSLYGMWQVNPETYIKANFDYPDLPQNVMVGERSGGFLLLENRKATTYTFNPYSQKSLTNASQGILSAHTNPKNIRLDYWKQLEKDDNFTVLGVITDGSGRKVQFCTDKHRWHKSKGYYNPSDWMPYHCKVIREDLPNGNYIIYDYVRWGEDKNYPSHKRIAAIRAYNSKDKLINELTFSYPETKRKIEGETQSINIRGGDRDAICSFKTNDKGHLELIYAGASHHVTTDYLYDKKMCLYGINYQDGRCFLNGYGSDGKVLEQYISMGPNGEAWPIAKFKYLTGVTEVRDGEDNLTVYRYDGESRIYATEKYLGTSLYLSEKNQWESDGTLRFHYFDDGNGRRLLTKAFEYDDRGNVTVETLSSDLTGNGIRNENYNLYQTYTSDGFNQLESVDDGSGKIVRYTYKAGTNLLETETVWVGSSVVKKTHYLYDESAVCIQKTVEAEGYKRITYVKPRDKMPCFGLPEVVEEKTIDSDGIEILLHKTVYTYEPSGKIKSEAHYDAEGVLRYTLRNEYDERERLKKSKDALGNETNYEYDENFNLIKKIEPQATTQWSYNYVNLPLTESCDGIKTHKIYDKTGRMTASTDACGQITHLTYDSLGRVIRVQHPDGGVEQKGYDNFGNVTQEIDSNGNTTSKKYNIRGQVTLVSYPDGTQERFRYLLRGLLAEHIDKTGCRTLYTYDPFDNVIEEKTYSASGALLKTLSATFSPIHMLSQTDENDVTTHFSYDYAGRKIAEQKGEYIVRYSYDALGRLTHTHKPGSVFVQEYDLLDRFVEQRTEDLEGNITFQEKYAYDAAGNKTEVITCAGTTRTQYNAHRLPVQITSPDGNITRIAYAYASYFVKTITDPNDVQTVETHDACRRLKDYKILNPQGKAIQRREFFYDLGGNKTHAVEHIYHESTPKQSIVNRWEYGLGNRLTKLIESDLKETNYFYDAYGRLTTTQKPDKTEISHTYDALGRLKTIKAADVDYTYTYDLKGRLTSVYDAIYKLTTERSYDIFDNFTREKLGNGYVLSYAYDTQRRLSQLHFPDKTSATFAYAGDHISQIAYQNHTIDYERNLHGKPTKIKLPSGAIQLKYDVCLRPKSIKSAAFTAKDYGYDPTGYLVHYTFTDPIGSVTADYTYDDLHQLTSESGHTYTYDSLNNRLSKNDMIHEHNTLSQLTHDGTTTYTYDLNGNLIQAGNTTFAYDALDRLTHVTKDGKTYQYIYDSFNRRLTKKGPKTIHYLWQGQNEIGSSDNELRILGAGLGAEIGAAAFYKLNNEIYFPIHDHRGAVVTLLSTQGKSLDTYRYTAFGEQLTDAKLSPWRFSSKRLDPETGYLYFGRRYYSPPLGRWTTPDPQGFSDGPNLYAYVHNSPLFAIDLYGLWGTPNRQHSDVWYRLEGSGHVLRDWTLNTLSRMGGWAWSPTNEIERNPLKGNWEPLSWKQINNYPAIIGRSVFPYSYDLQHLPSNISREEKMRSEGAATLEKFLFMYTLARAIPTSAIKSISNNPSIFALTSGEYVYSGIPDNIVSASPVRKKTNRNFMKPDVNAEGAHSVVKRHPVTGELANYESFWPQTNPYDPKPWQSEIRYDSSVYFHQHFNKYYKEWITTPHVHDINWPGGIRRPEPREIP